VLILIRVQLASVLEIGWSDAQVFTYQSVVARDKIKCYILNSVWCIA